MKTKHNLEEIKKRIKGSTSQSNSLDQEISVQETATLHPEFARFLTLLFSQDNLLHESGQNDSAIKRHQIMEAYISTLEELQKTKNSTLYFEEIQRTYEFLRGFKGALSTAGLFMFCAAILRFSFDSQTSETKNQLYDDFFNSPHFLEAVKKEEETVNIYSTEIDKIALQKYENDNSVTHESAIYQFLLLLAKRPQNQVPLLMNLKIRDIALDGVIAAHILLKLNSEELPKNDVNVLSKILNLTWLPNLTCRRKSLIALSNYYISNSSPDSEHSFGGEEIDKEMASVLFFNKLSHGLLEDPTLNESFKALWTHFGQKKVKTLINQHYFQFRKFYLDLFEKTTEVAVKSTQSEMQHSISLLHRCILLAISEIQLRVEPADAPSTADNEIINFVIAIQTAAKKPQDLTYILPRLKSILVKLAQKSTFDGNSDAVRSFLKSLIKALKDDLNSIKIKFVQELATAFNQEKYHSYFSTIALEFWEEEQSEANFAIIIAAFETLPDSASDSDKVRQIVSEKLSNIDKIDEILLKFIMKVETAPRLKQMLAEQILLKTDALSALITDESTKAIVSQLVNFCATELVALIASKTTDERNALTNLSNIEALIIPVSDDNRDDDQTT